MTTTIEAPRVYQLATIDPPEISCPPWCTVDKQTHLDGLNDWEGRCLHRGDFPFPVGAAPYQRPDDIEVSICRTLLPDGTDDPLDGEDPRTPDAGAEPYFKIGQHDLTLDEALAYGRFIIERATAAREGRA